MAVFYLYRFPLVTNHVCLVIGNASGQAEDNYYGFFHENC